jgi:hypothetical protein
MNNICKQKFWFAPKSRCPDSEVVELSVEEVVEDIKKGKNFFCEKMGEKYYPNGYTKFYADIDLDNYKTREEAEQVNKQVLTQ